jgi:pimeloyl-ACP methyl ester carboxylesterase
MEIIMSAGSTAANVVLVHGGFVDGSGWQPVYDRLKQDGHNVSIVQNPTLSLEGDVAATQQVIHAQDGPVVLVGHSYGGAVITEAGTDQNVAALVYIAAFVPDKGESVNTLIADPPPGAPVRPILPPRDGFLFLDREKFAASFAGDLPAEQAAFMADSQVPCGVGALGGSISEPAWRTKPSWYLVAAEDPDDPPAGPARHVRASRLDRGRGPRKPRHLRVEAGASGRSHRAGRRRTGRTAVGSSTAFPHNGRHLTAAVAFSSSRGQGVGRALLPTLLDCVQAPGSSSTPRNGDTSRTRSSWCIAAGQRVAWTITDGRKQSRTSRTKHRPLASTFGSNINAPMVVGSAMRHQRHDRALDATSSPRSIGWWLPRGRGSRATLTAAGSPVPAAIHARR